MPDSPRTYEVLLAGPTQAARLLASAPTADAATVAFHAVLAQLRRARASGEVVLRVGDGVPRTLLRVPLR